MITLKLNNIGRQKFCGKVKGKNLQDALTQALKEAKKHLLSREVSIVEKNEGSFNIYAGFHCVGEIDIIKS